MKAFDNKYCEKVNESQIKILSTETKIDNG